MTWNERLGSAWRNDGLVRALMIGIFVNILSAPVLYGFGNMIPMLSNKMPVPAWLLVWLMGIIPVSILSLFLFLRRGVVSKERVPMQFDTHEEGGEAYILFEVEPEFSESLARELSEKDGVRFAAAVWGHWDVIARVRMGTSRLLISFLTDIQTHSKIIRTETHIIRNDQPQHYSSPREDHFAVLLLKIHARRTGQILKQLRTLKPESDIAHVEHAAGILGAYDIALTVRYARDEELAKLVMQYAQRTLRAETMTMPAIRGMTYIEGKAF